MQPSPREEFRAEKREESLCKFLSTASPEEHDAAEDLARLTFAKENPSSRKWSEHLPGPEGEQPAEVDARYMRALQEIHHRAS